MRLPWGEGWHCLANDLPSHRISLIKRSAEEDKIAVKAMQYTFRRITECEMCGSPSTDHKVLGKRLNGTQGAFPKRTEGISVTVKKCRWCELVFADPQPVPFDLQDHYGVPPEVYWKPEYFMVAPDYFSNVIERFLQLKEPGHGKKSLDIGAGLGHAMIAMERAGFDAYGFEPSVEFRNRAVSQMGISPDSLLLGDMETIAYDPGSFDFISFGAVLEHLYEPSAAIRKALTWLRPGGLIHIEVPSSRWLVNRIMNVAYRLQGTDYVANISPMHLPYHLYEFSLKSFQLNAGRNDFEIAFHEHYVCQTFLPRMLDPVLKPWMRHTGTGMQLSIWLRKP